MNSVYLSKSKYCRCVQCQKILWLEKYKPECATPEDKTVIFENGHKVGELAKGLFGDYEDIPFHTAQRLYSWKSSSDFVAAVCENRPAFEEKHFAGLWETEKETAIANLMRESYSKAVKQ